MRDVNCSVYMRNPKISLHFTLHHTSPRLLVYGEFFRRHLAHKHLDRHLQTVLVQRHVKLDVVPLRAHACLKTTFACAVSHRGTTPIYRLSGDGLPVSVCAVYPALPTPAQTPRLPFSCDPTCIELTTAVSIKAGVPYFGYFALSLCDTSA